MKIRWIFIVLLIVMFFTVPGVSYCEDEQPCQPYVTVMFGNGVGNSYRSAYRSRLILEVRLEAHISGTDLEGIIKYDLSYNPSEGAFADFLETFEQTLQTN